MLRSSLLRQAIQGIIPVVTDMVDEKTSSLLSHLTRREMDVLRLLAEGSGNRDICTALSLAEVTVKKHVQSIISKMGASDRTHVAVLGVRLGLGPSYQGVGQGKAVPGQTAAA